MLKIKTKIKMLKNSTYEENKGRKFLEYRYVKRDLCLK